MTNKRTIFWTLMTDDRGQRETHQSNWVWFIDTLGTKVEWKKEMLGKMWKGVRVPLFKRGVYNTISVGELIKAFGTPDDKKQWCKTLKDIGALGFGAELETAQPHTITASPEETH